MYFNELDPYAVAWLRNLWPGAVVEDRSIVEVRPSDLTGHLRVHLFAGIGGWEYALQLADWPEGEEVWTGSCPCQPFSGAGRNDGVLDERHLWPAFHRLIAERRPPVVFGEQVASAAGRAWLAGVCTDLEDLGYAVGAADLCAASLGAPHIRQRLYWVADRNSERWRSEAASPPGYLDSAITTCRMADPGRQRDERLGTMGDVRGETSRLEADASERERGGPDPWGDYEWIPCRDGYQRRIESGIRPLAHGVSNRVGRLRAYGNAIVPHVGAAFVRAYLEAKEKRR